MNRSGKIVAVLLCSAIILLSVFSNTGFPVNAQSVDYLSDTAPTNTLKDMGNTEYTLVSSAGTVTGKSGAVYNKGVCVKLTRDSDDGMSFMTLTYDVKNNANSFSCYIDVDSDSENDGDYSVKFEVFAGNSAVFTQVLTPSTKYPVKVNASIGTAQNISVRLGDTSPNEGETSFVLGNAAMCQSGSSIPSVTVPDAPADDEADEDGELEEEEEDIEDEDEEESVSDTDNSVTDLSANRQELLNKATKYMEHSYLLVTMQLSWEQAATWCEMQGGYLATVTSETENKFIADYLRSLGNRSAYLGMSGNSESGDFKWQNGEAALYSNWARQTSTVSGKSYLQMGGGTDTWTMGKPDGQYLSFIIEWGEKAPLSDGTDSGPDSAVIIIAGLGSSNLSDSDTGRTWAKESENYFELSPGNVSWSKSGVTAAGSDYGTADTYKPLMESISDVCSDSDVVLFEWDWRANASDAADELAGFIEDGGWSSVTLIGHNTGGLVACYYIDSNGTDSIEQLITLGTPFYGTQKAFCMMQTGFFAQGANSVKGSAGNVHDFPSLASLVPEKPSVGNVNFTGKFISSMTRAEVLEAAGADSSVKSDSAALKDVYKLISEGTFGGAYIVAGTGIATVESVIVEDGEITDLNTTFDGDGLTDIGSAVMNFESARPPYIIDGTDTTGLVTDKNSITLVCNILSGKADTSDYADGITSDIYRTRTASESKPVEISISGSAKITVSDNSRSVTLNGSSFSFSKGGQEAMILKNGTKSVFASENAQITIELLGSGVCLEISDENGTRAWTDIPLDSGAVLKTTASSDVLSVISDPTDNGISEIESDPVPVIVPEEEEEEETEEKKSTHIPWNVWTAGGLIVAAAAVALIVTPYCAYRVSKVETDRKKRLIRQKIRRQRQQLNTLRQNAMSQNMAQGYPAEQTPVYSELPMLIAPQNGMAAFSMEEAIDENYAVDIEDVINRQM